MRKLTVMALVAAGLALAALGQGIGSRPAIAGPAPGQVLVVNGPSQAVPTRHPSQTVVAETTTTIGVGNVTVGPFDVHDLGKIRVFYQLESDGGFVQCNPEVVATDGRVFKLDDPMVTSFPATRVYDVPGPTFRLTCFQDASAVLVLHVAIYGM